MTSARASTATARRPSTAQTPGPCRACEERHRQRDNIRAAIGDLVAMIADRYALLPTHQAVIDELTGHG